MDLGKFIDVLCFGIFGIFIFAIMGCAHHSGKILTFDLYEHPEKPRPACKYELKIDEKLVHWGLVEKCPDQLPGGEQ